GIVRLLLRTRLPHEISPQFEFGLALLDGSGVGTEKGREGRGKTGRMPVDRPKATPADRKTSAGDPGDAGAPEGAPIGAPADASVLLFKGCVTEGLFQRVNEATTRVLEVNGCTVQAPSGQVCCGALHAHAGDLEGARVLARQNVAAFEDAHTKIITNAGGCGAMLVSYGHLLVNDEVYANRAKEFSARVQDISQHLR